MGYIYIYTNNIKWLSDGFTSRIQLVMFYDVVYFAVLVHSIIYELDMIHMWVCLKHGGFIPQDAMFYTEKYDD